MDGKTADGHIGDERIALSITTVGVLMASIDGFAVIIALPTAKQICRRVLSL